MISTYVLDSRDRIVSVDEGWRAFARANGAPDLADSVVGTSFWDHVHGDGVRHLQRILLERVRAGADVALPFRCDAPALRRFMEMRMARAGPEVVVACREVRSEGRAPVALLDAGAARDPDRHLVMCAWCRRVAGQGAWREVEVALAENRVFEREPVPSVSHGLCPDCEGGLLQGLPDPPAAAG